MPTDPQEPRPLPDRSNLRHLNDQAKDLVKAGTAKSITDPELHHAPLGYAKNGPLTWVAECRVPWEPPSPLRLAIAKWMIENGSDVHQGGDGPLMRAALKGDRIPMMELLVSYGADVNTEWNGEFPIIFAPNVVSSPLRFGRPEARCLLWIALP